MFLCVGGVSEKMAETDSPTTSSSEEQKQLINIHIVTIPHSFLTRAKTLQAKKRCEVEDIFTNVALLKISNVIFQNVH